MSPGIAALTEAVLLRRIYKLPHTFCLLVTVGIALVIQEFVIIFWGSVGGSVRTPDMLSGIINLGDFIYPIFRLFVIGFTIVLAAILWWALEGTRLGAILRAGSESSETMSRLGYDTLKINTIVFGLGAGLAALVGATAAPIWGVDPFMGIKALSIAFVVVIGGMVGSLPSVFWCCPQIC